MDFLFLYYRYNTHLLPLYCLYDPVIIFVFVFVFFLIQERENLIQSFISRLWSIWELNLATVYSLMTGLYLFKFNSS